MLLALPAAAQAAAQPAPLIVDTDMFGDADDAGALATAFGLQYLGEAKVIAVAVNTNTTRTLATDSWKCVAAITNFYGSASVPIGTAMPNNGPSADSLFAKPCADLAPASTPPPGDAVDVYRQALATQPDHSVVIVSVGFMGNLAALLDADPDLVAQKVKTLVVMGGRYDGTTMRQTNLRGDPAAAQTISAHWPSKIVWSGYEVGIRVQAGQSIPRVHPADSPVRVAYEKFAAGMQMPDTALFSWDLTAIYDAVRPSDPVWTEVGPGTNDIGADGSNAFHLGAGNQYYLRLSSGSQLSGKIETLLDTLSAPPPPPPPSGPPPTQTAPPASAPPADSQPPATTGPGTSPVVTAPPLADSSSAPVAPPRRRSAAHCVVPTLTGRSLAGARKLLRAHHCALGRVHHPRRTKHRRHVVRQSITPRAVRRAGTRVDLTLR